MKKVLYSILLFTIISCTNKPTTIEGVWWYLDGSVYHEMEFLDGQVFNRSSFRPIMSEYTLSVNGKYTVDSNKISINLEPRIQTKNNMIRFELDETGNKLSLKEKEHVFTMERVRKVNPSIGSLVGSQTPIKSNKWKEYIEGFYVREFNCYVKNQQMYKKEAEIIRDSLTILEIGMLGKLKN